MKTVRLRLVQSSVTRVRADLKRRLLRMRSAVQMQARREMVAVARAAVQVWPVATGQSADGVHVIPGLESGNHYRIGVGVTRTPNGQEVKAEAGWFTPHTDAHDMDRFGRLCSSGAPGGWDDPEEAVNVRALHGAVRVNPHAVARPLAHAIIELHGQIVDTDEGRSWEPGAGSYRYRRTAVKGEDKLRPRLKAAADGGLKQG